MSAMVAEPWIRKMRTQVGANLKYALSVDSNSSTTTKKKDSKASLVPNSGPKADTIGILSFEVANAMSKAIHLHKSLSEAEVSNLYNEVLKFHGVRTLVSDDESYLLELALAEKLDELNRVAALVSRLGKRCTEQVLVGFEHVYADLLSGRIEVGKLGFLVKDMEKTIKKMERYVRSAGSLYGELGVLNELEQGVKKFQLARHQEETRKAIEQKIQWQRHNIRHLRDTSLWNQTYDKIVGVMARAVCTLFARIRVVFGEIVVASEVSPDHSRQFFSKRIQTDCRLPSSGVLNSAVSDGKPGQIRSKRPVGNLRGEGFAFPCGPTPGKLFMECLSLSSSASWKDNGDHFEGESHISRVGTGMPCVMEDRKSKINSGLIASHFGSKSNVVMHAAPSTVGASALPLHYANIIIIIEKLLLYPHLVGEDARDDLYEMLPMSLRMALRRSLKSYVENVAIYDAPLAHGWKERLNNILSWLAPMAHSMIRWQTEHNFEQQQIVTRTNLLLLQTLYFADREKTEAAICELLVGLNYICRYEHQQNALLDCRSSADFDEGIDWQLQY